MDDRFFNGIIGSKAKVCGRKLENLTSWHYILLSAIGNPTVIPDKKSEPHHILQLLKIVTCSYPEIPDLSPNFRDIFWMIRMKRRSFIHRQIDILKEWMANSSGGNLSSPALFALVVELVAKGNLRLSEAWNMRISEARWFDTTMAEILGGTLKIVDDTDIKPEDNKSESEVIEVARKELNKYQFKQWMAARKTNNLTRE